jgi:2-oxoacid dehydrogenases acyltransferase (catalytic domain)
MASNRAIMPPADSTSNAVGRSTKDCRRPAQVQCMPFGRAVSTSSCSATWTCLTWIEREIAGQPQVLPCIVRAANRKTFREIHDEIRTAQVQDVAKIEVGGAKAAQRLPAWLFPPVLLVAIPIGKRFPRVWKQSWGTVTISAVGMVGKGAGWGIPPSSPSICWITVGGIGRKQEDVDGESATEYLNLTVSFDHNMMDAAPAARFTERLKELIESGYGLALDRETIAQPIATQRVPKDMPSP